MKVNEKVLALVNRFPGKGGRDLPRDADDQAMREVLRDLHAGGRDSVRGLVALLVVPGKGDDSKARYVLHALATFVCSLKNKQRQAFAQALASTLAENRPAAVKAFILRQLQVAGGKEVVPIVAEYLVDPQLGESAAQALLAIGTGAAREFRNALARAKGKNRLTIVQALGSLRDEESTRALQAVVNDPDRDTRLAALWALGNLGDAGSVGVLLKAADVPASWERIQATKACLVLAERLQGMGKKAEAITIYEHLQKTRKDESEAYVQEIASEALKTPR
jgi:HEAT repeat protein